MLIHISQDGQVTADLQLELPIPVTPLAADAPNTLTALAGFSLNGFQIAAQAPIDRDIVSDYYNTV